MKLFLVIAISTVVLGQIFARPSNVEVEKHHVVEISRNFNITAMNSTAKIDETKRILKEIERINQSLGYTKKNLARTDSLSESERLSDALFFPKTPFHPPGVGKSEDLRSQRVKYKKEMRQGKFLIIPLDPSFVAILPHFSARTARLSKKWNKKPLKSQKKEYEKTERPPLLKQNSLFDVLIDEMVDDEEEEDDLDNSSLQDNDEYINDLYRNILVRPNKRDLEKEESLDKEGKFPLITTKKPKPTTHKPPKPFNKPKTTTKKPPTKVPNPDDLKSPFSSLFRPASEQLKDSGGGIIIQRLKVRKGGIAIAGPGGVATAGSGGTAIVGPGGIAFTHPRGLTIAGPGAKVFSVPEHVDLESVSLNSTSRDFPFPSEIVATGPIVYYNPGK